MECIQLSLFGKTYQEPLAQMAEKTSEQSWKNLPAWNSQTFQFLDLRVGGQMEQSRSNRRKRMVSGLATA